MQRLVLPLLAAALLLPVSAAAAQPLRPGDQGERVRALNQRLVELGHRPPGTPRGTFRVTRKERSSWSVPCKVWLPYASYFTGGIALHESDSVPAHAASHGCVRIPEPFAAEVYAFTSLDTRVRVI